MCMEKQLTLENDNLESVLLAEGEFGLIYDWGRDDFAISLLKKENGSLKFLFQDSVKNPAFYKNDKIRIHDSLLDNLKIQMSRRMMLDDRNVEFMMITGIGPANKEVWEKFYDSVDDVLNCLLDGKTAEIKLGNFLASITEDFTQEDFAVALKLFFYDTKKLLDQIVEKQRNEANPISRVILSGEYGTLTFVEKWVKEYFGEEVCISKNVVKKPDDGFVYLPKRG